MEHCLVVVVVLGRHDRGSLSTCPGVCVFQDFIHVAGPLGVSHILAVSQTDTAPYWRIVKAPHGPTLTFRIDSYALMKDVQGAQRRPRCPASLFRTAPLVVINNMQNNKNNHIKLAAVMAQVRS